MPRFQTGGRGRARLLVASVPTALLPLSQHPALGYDALPLPEAVVTAPPIGLGAADTASQGVVGPRQLQEFPTYREGETLETVPGLTVTQHSGEGKANQYFLRGFSLDHGTDIDITLDGMPVNLRTHAHGQGYSDPNFMIPELVRQIDYSHPRRFQQGRSRNNGSSISGMFTQDAWHASNQIPERAVSEGLVSRFGTIEPTDGGKAQRYSVSGRYADTDDQRQIKANAYAIGDSLTLFNNFDFNVLFPPPIGVQFQQSERRKIIGGSASYTAFGCCSGGPPPAPSASIPASTTSI